MLLSQVKDPIKYDELSFSQLLDVIAGEKIWKEFQYAPLPQDIIIKKESDKSEPAPKTNSSEKTKDAIRINGTHISDFKDHERVLDESDGTSPNIGSRSQPE